MKQVNVSKGTFSLPDFFKSEITKAAQRSKEHWQKTAPPIIIKNIKDTIERGNSPVKGFTRFVEYSASYKRQINRGRYRQYGKKLRPINLTLSGKMMRSLIHRVTAGGFTVYFTNKLAKIHSEEGPGGKKSAIRKIMPSASEQFKKSITFESDEIIRKKLLKEFENIF